MSAATDFPLVVIVPVPTAFILKLVYVPPVDRFIELTLTMAAAGVVLLPVKSRLLIQLPVEIVGIAEPEVIAKLGAVVVEPP